MILSDVCPTSVCLTSVAYIGPKSRTERPMKTNICTEVAHVTRDSGTTFKIKRSKVKVTRRLYSRRRLHIRQLQRWAWESIHRGNLTATLPSAGAAVGLATRGVSAPTEGEVGRGHIVAATRLQLVPCCHTSLLHFKYVSVSGNQSDMRARCGRMKN